MTPDESRALALLAADYRPAVRAIQEWRSVPDALRREGERRFAARYGSPIDHDPSTVGP